MRSPISSTQVVNLNNSIITNEVINKFTQVINLLTTLTINISLCQQHLLKLISHYERVVGRSILYICLSKIIRLLDLIVNFDENNSELRMTIFRF